MKLTKRQWIMFTLFIIVFAHTLFSAAMAQSVNVILSNLSVLMFLAALYMDKSGNSRFVLLLSAIWIIVNAIFDYMQVIPQLLNNFSLPTLISIITSALKFVAIYYFAMAFYKDGFRKFKNNLLITVLLLPALFNVLYVVYSYLGLPAGLFSPLELFMLYIGLIINSVLPIAMLLYTWLRYHRIS